MIEGIVGTDDPSQMGAETPDQTVVLPGLTDETVGQPATQDMGGVEARHATALGEDATPRVVAHAIDP